MPRALAPSIAAIALLRIASGAALAHEHRRIGEDEMIAGVLIGLWARRSRRSR